MAQFARIAFSPLKRPPIDRFTVSAPQSSCRIYRTHDDC